MVRAISAIDGLRQAIPHPVLITVTNSVLLSANQTSPGPAQDLPRRGIGAGQGDEVKLLAGRVETQHRVVAPVALSA